MPKNRLILIAKLAVTGLLIAFVLRGVAFDEVGARLSRLAPAPVIAAAALIAFQMMLIVTWRWQRIVAAIDDAAPFARLLRIVVISLFFNQVLPSTVGGDGMRMWLLRRLGRGVGISIRSVVLDRLLGLSSLFLLSLVGALYLLVRLPDSALVWPIALLSLCGLAAIAGAPLFLRLFGRLPVAFLRRNLETVAAEVDLLWRDKGLLVRLIAASLLGQIAMCASIWLLAASLGIAFGLLDALAVLPAVLLIASVPISIAGWGVREGSMVVGLGLLGVGTGDAALVSIFFGVLLLVFGLLGGLVWLLDHGPRPMVGRDGGPASLR